MLSSAAAVAIGVVSSSLVLVAFGATGAIDAAGSWALAMHFRHVQHHDSIDSRRERTAHLIISVGLVVVGVSAVGESVHRLVVHRGADSAPAGAVVAAVSAVVLAILAMRKRRLATRLGSAPLRSDGNLSATGAALAVVAVVGAAINGVDWLDPACALAIGSVAAASGALSLHGGA